MTPEEQQKAEAIKDLAKRVAQVLDESDQPSDEAVTAAIFAAGIAGCMMGMDRQELISIFDQVTAENWVNWLRLSKIQGSA